MDNANIKRLKRENQEIREMVNHYKKQLQDEKLRRNMIPEDYDFYSYISGMERVLDDLGIILDKI